MCVDSSWVCCLLSYTGEYDVLQIETTKAYGITEWREDLKKLLRRTGVDGSSTVFMLSDTQIRDDILLEV